MKQIEQKIFSVDVVDVAIVGVGPACRPDIHELKAVAAILKLRSTLHDYRSCRESMAAAKVSAELVVRNVGTLAPSPGVLRLLFRTPFLLPLLILFLCPLFLFRRLGLVPGRLHFILRFNLILLWLGLGFFLLCGFVVLWLVILGIDKG